MNDQTSAILIGLAVFAILMIPLLVLWLYYRLKSIKRESPAPSPAPPSPAPDIPDKPPVPPVPPEPPEPDRDVVMLYACESPGEGRVWICPHCGVENDAFARDCAVCGHSLR